jgi:ribosome-binding protein aMBF1 (putative translation factor)
MRSSMTTKRARLSEADDLDLTIEEFSREDPEFQGKLDAAVKRQELLHRLAAARKRAGLSRTAVAARMGTSESMVIRLEKGESEVKLSTVQRFAEAVGVEVQFTVAPAGR